MSDKPKTGASTPFFSLAVAAELWMRRATRFFSPPNCTRLKNTPFMVFPARKKDPTFVQNKKGASDQLQADTEAAQGYLLK
jgi:hypothetical protein